jgi:antiviral helicase SLH1
MVDSLNAEIALGTITSVQDAIQWLGYTYLFVRMRREPFIYGMPSTSQMTGRWCTGMPHDELKDDPQLGNKRNELITQSARHLATAKMARYDEHTNAFVISDLGRIAAKYYLKHQTIDVFSTSPYSHWDKLMRRWAVPRKNAERRFIRYAFKSYWSKSSEYDWANDKFEQIQLRETEVPELTAIMETEEYCPLEVKGGVSTKQGKVNIL